MECHQKLNLTRYPYGDAYIWGSIPTTSMTKWDLPRDLQWHCKDNSELIVGDKRSPFKYRAKNKYLHHGVRLYSSTGLPNKRDETNE